MQLPWSKSAKETVSEIALKWAESPPAEFINEIKQKSMLHQETLMLLDYFARKNKHAILEIGTYTGAATVVIARARNNNCPQIAVEMGGSHDHPQLPSKDIISDFCKTLKDYGVEEKVSLIKGWSNSDETIEEVSRLLGNSKIGLLVMDADGMVERDFEIYKKFLAPNAIIVCDDYEMFDDKVDKSLTVRPWVEKVISEGICDDLGIYKWGTWFGRLSRAAYK